MNPIIQQLAWVQKKHLFQEKILLTPSYSEGFILLESMASAGYPSLNFRPETIPGLANSILLPHQQLVSNPVLDHLLWEILMDLASRETLQYFLLDNISYSLAIAVRRAIITLKGARQTPDGLAVDAFVSPDKGRDLQQIFGEYQYVLQQKGWFDTADGIEVAIQHYRCHKVDTIFIIPETLALTALQSELVEILAQKTTCYQLVEPVIPGGPHMDLRVPIGLKQIPVSCKAKDSPLQFLYRIEDAPAGEEARFQLYSAYGVSNEVQEVFRRIKRRRIPLDQVAIYTTAHEPYHQLFFELASRFSIPITFSSGLRIVNFRPGRLFLNILEWIEEEFSVSVFIQILRSGDFHLGDKRGPSAHQLMDILRQSNILRYRERYTILQERAQGENQMWAASFFQRLLQEIPPINKRGLMNYSQLLTGLFNIIAEYSHTISSEDVQARDDILQLLFQLQETSSTALMLQESLYRLKKIVSQMRVGQSTPRPGHLHVSHYAGSRYLEGRCLFFVGFDSTRFPGTVLIDPILLESEREKLKDVSLPSQDPIRRTIHLMKQLPYVKHPFTISYSSFDTVESREMFPSTILLQLFRLLHQDPLIDYSTLQKKIGRTVGFSPEDPVSTVGEGECWLTYLTSFYRKGAVQKVLQYYPSLGRGVEAWTKRNNGEFNAFMGHLPKQPTGLTDRIFSATRLETMGTCPYRFFLTYILALKPREDLFFDPNSWLNPLTRGSLLHGIFEAFYHTLLQRDELPSFKRHRSLLEDIVEAEIQNMLREVPIPSEVVYEAEVREILQSALLFLKSEEDLTDKLPVQLELSFGFMGEGGEEPMEIHLPSGLRFFLAGRIDRVDQREDGYVIMDYKTGSTYAYWFSDYLKGARQLQHALYALAFEVMMKKKTGAAVSVVQSGYIFPTLKGEGERFLRTQEERGSVYEVLDILFALMKKGHFPATDDTNDCKFCDFPSICQREALDEVWNDLFTNHPEIQEFQVVRDYK